MGLIFVPYMRETLRKSFQRVSSEPTSEARSLARATNSNEQSYQSLEDLVRIYDNPDASEADIPGPSGSNGVEGETHHSGSNSPATERPARVPGDHTFFFPLRRPPTAPPGSSALSGVDRRTVRLLEVLSTYYVRSASSDRVRANSNSTPPPPPTASSSTGATSSPSSPSASSSSARGLSLLQGTPNSSDVLPRAAPAVPERRDSIARLYDANRSISSQTEEWESDSRTPQFIFGPHPSGMSAEELRFSNWHNGPLTFHSSNDDPDSTNVRSRRPRIASPAGPGLLRAPDQRTDDELLSSVRRRRNHLSSGSSSGSEDPSNGLLRYSSNADHDSESTGSSNPQAFLWHNETRRNVTTHGCLRVIMRRHQGWEEQVAQNGFVEYWHYSTIPRREPLGFEVVRDGVARVPWPMLAVAELHTLRSFAYQVNSVHHRQTPTTDYQGNVFDVILVPSMQVTLGLEN